MSERIGIAFSRSISIAIVRRWLLGVMLLCLVTSPVNAQAKDGNTATPLILAHFMPWFEADPTAKTWGWHWTMNAYKPNEEVKGRSQIASHFYPLIGPYDSGDAHVLECQLLQMKLAGIDGVIVDWYGLQDFRDYPLLHRNTQRLVEQVTRLGMQFAICYEDQTIPALVEAGNLKADQRIAHATAEIDWLREHWFTLKSYVRLDGRPVLLTFGQTGLTDEEWSSCITGLKAPVSYFSQHNRRASAIGAFDWPIPQEGVNGVDQFLKRHKDWPQSIPVAFPRFIDIYAEAKVQKSWGRIEDDDGKTFRASLTKALFSQSRIIQIATWNDWGEGTIIEPSLEFGYRDLEVLQELRRKYVDTEFSAVSSDLRIPAAILSLRREAPDKAKRLDTIVKHIVDGQLRDARSSINANGPIK